MLEFDTLGVIEKEEIDSLVHRLPANPDIADVCTPGNPRDVTIDDIKALYKKVL